MPPDYSGQNLRGRSFKGQNLEGANFSKANIRGANFTNAILKDTDFIGATAGLELLWAIALLIVALPVLALAFIYSIIIGLSVANIFDTKYPGNILIGGVSLAFVVVFCIVTIRKSLTAGVGFGGGVLVSHSTENRYKMGGRTSLRAFPVSDWERDILKTVHSF